MYKIPFSCLQTVTLVFPVARIADKLVRYNRINSNYIADYPQDVLCSYPLGCAKTY